MMKLFVVGPGTFNSFLFLLKCTVRNPLGGIFFSEKKEARKEGVRENSGRMKSQNPLAYVSIALVFLALSY
jgi:hypothetical protein